MGEAPRHDSSADELLPKVASGDAAAFTALYRRHSGDVFRFALHMTGSRAAADDVTQEVFLAVMHDAARYVPGQSSEAAWLRGIARNHVRRRLAREPCRGVSLTEFDGQDGFAVAGDDGGPLHDMLRAERIAALREAVSRLPVRYREALVLCDLQELSYADAAAAIGCAIGTVRSRLSRARALLTSRLGAAARMSASTGEATSEEGAETAAREKVRTRWAI